MRLSKSIPAGLVDAAAAALATFIGGVYAARYFTPGELGVYALFFAAFLMAAIVPFALTFQPGEVRLLDLPNAQRLGGFRLTMPAGVPVASATAVITLVAMIPGSDADAGLLFPLALTVFITSILSPVQDHVRRVMHMAGESWLAVATSFVQLTVVSVSVVLGLATGIDDVWIPFGGLAAANLVSIGIGLLLARRRSERPPGDAYPLAGLAKSGRWLTGIWLMPAGAGFLAAAIVDITVGGEFLGFAEAARVAARPLLVFMTGLSAVINPPSMEAGRDRDHREGLRLARLADKLVLAVGVVVLLWLGLDWPGNPMSWLVEEAYTVGGLVAVTLVANVAWGMLFSQASQLIGGAREVDLFKVHVAGAVAQVIVAFSAPVTESFAIPLSIGAFALVRWVGFLWALNRLYTSPRDTETMQPDATLRGT